MAGHTIIAAFEDYSGALSAIREMESGESAVARVSLVANNAGNRYGTFPRPQGGRSKASGAFLAEIGAVVIPGIGPVVAAGPVAAALGHGAGLVGALVEIGLPRAPAELYAEAVRRGATLVAVRIDPDNRDTVFGILERYRPMDIEERAAEWRHEGWRHFDERGAPHPGPYYGSSITLNGAPTDQGISLGRMPEGGPPPSADQPPDQVRELETDPRGEAAPPGGWTIRREGPVGADWAKSRVRVYPVTEDIPDDGRA